MKKKILILITILIILIISAIVLQYNAKKAIIGSWYILNEVGGKVSQTIYVIDKDKVTVKSVNSDGQRFTRDLGKYSLFFNTISGIDIGEGHEIMFKYNSKKNTLNEQDGYTVKIFKPLKFDINQINIYKVDSFALTNKDYEDNLYKSINRIEDIETIINIIDNAESFDYDEYIDFVGPDYAFERIGIDDKRLALVYFWIDEDRAILMHHSDNTTLYSFSEENKEKLLKILSKEGK